MKIRLAKKIMKHKCTFLDLEEKYKKERVNYEQNRFIFSITLPDA